ncbi:PTS system mannose/fructose/sorbose family transporter subunit IID [Collinsella sp. zg1085]|uniref:PTS system mannose/fructose/sorbose family transporter subunit IID n=1 Tax=Collinsella sp. zg1085 TaxID=2844380 RepID=UPI001C0C4570|nr:PTS system mannose/fructose/sorbose family transporter subunit IID [Collinsella sp. zg1085]QWT17556.1 PTS system mannose/fructose/sorbose family transporter subunit IID [Collinsella sp. zg1085]
MNSKLNDVRFDNLVEDSTTKCKLNKQDLRRVFWRSCMLDSSWTYERQQNMGYSYAMTRVVEKLYQPGSEKLKHAYQRGLDFMAITPQLSTLLMGIDAALCERDACDSEFDESTIQGIKTSLMGPLAGIGDSLIASTLRIIGTSIALGFAQQGSVLGPILLLVIFNVPGFLIRWFGLQLGYKYGSSIITSTAAADLMKKISFAASVVGLMAIGGMVASFISLDLSLMVGSSGYAQPLSEILDMIMPCMPQAAVFGFMYWVLGKKVKTTHVLLLTIVLCIGVAWASTMVV